MSVSSRGFIFESVANVMLLKLKLCQCCGMLQGFATTAMLQVKVQK